MPELTEAYNSLGVALTTVGRPLEAIAQLKIALRLEPGSERAHLNMSSALAQSGRLAEALHELEQTSRTSSNPAIYEVPIARVLLRLGRTDEAIAHFRSAAQSNPADFEAWSALTELA